MVPMSADVVIVGGGIMGCAAAYYLARGGVSVVLLERDAVAGQQSSRAWGFLRQQGRHPAEIPLAREATAMWSGLEQELDADLEYVRRGILVAAETEADESRLTIMGEEARRHDIPVRLVSAAEIGALLPGIAANWRAGLLSEGDGHAEPALATRAFARAAIRQGATLREAVPALAIETAAGRVTGVRTPDGVVAAGAVLCAGGIGTADLVAPLGLSLPIQPVRASVAQTNPPPAGASSSASGVAVWSPRVSFRPKRDGSYYVSNGYRGIDAEHDLTLRSFRHLRAFLPTLLRNRRTIRLRIGATLAADLCRRIHARPPASLWDEPPVNWSLVRQHQACFHEAMPALRGCGLARAWAGRIDATPDLIPIIEVTAAPRNLVVAAGFNGHGFALAPAVGRQLACVLMGEATSVDLAPFRLRRFRERAESPAAAPL